MQQNVNLSNSSIVEKLLIAPQYSLGYSEKSALLQEELRGLTAIHRRGCETYRHLLDGLALSHTSPSLAGPDGSFIPVRLFKTLQLQSISDLDVLKVLTSSGTTSQQVSRIAVDRETSML